MPSEHARNHDQISQKDNISRKGSRKGRSAKSSYVSRQSLKRRQGHPSDRKSKSNRSSPMSQRVEADNVPNQYQMDIYALVKDPQSIVIKREQEAQNNRSKSELSQSEDSQAREIGRSDRAVNAMVLPQERPAYYQKKSKFASKY